MGILDMAARHCGGDALEHAAVTSGVPGISAVLEAAGERARRAGVFSGVSVRGERLECDARGAASPAFYRVEADGGRLWVSLVMADRWLSESIEADLMHTGDKLEELLEEELVELGHRGVAVPFEHFRSEDKQFTFRSPVSVLGGGEGGDEAGALLLAYEACFRHLGDMSGGGEA